MLLPAHSCIGSSRLAAHNPAHPSSSAALVMRRLHTSPLWGRLSQDIIVNGRVPLANRTAAAAQIRPNVVGFFDSG